MLLGLTAAPGCLSGCVCCILIVAFGIVDFAPSGGIVMRAVSFFGEAAFCVTGSGGGLMPLPAGATGLAGADGAGTGFNGTVGLAPSDGGFGGGFTPLRGFIGAAPKEPGGFGGGTKGFDDGGGGTADAGGVVTADPGFSGSGIFVVSFFGPTPGGVVEAGLPGRLIRTVSRLAVGCSGLAGSVMRIVSAFAASSEVSEGAGGISSGIKFCAKNSSHPALAVSTAYSLALPEKPP